MSLFINPDDRELSYMGRTEAYGNGVRFVFAGTSVTIRFRGTFVKCIIRNHKFFNVQEIGTVVDGKVGKITFEQKEEDITLSIAEGLENKIHEVTLYKRQDAAHYFEFKGFEVDDNAEVLEPKNGLKRRMECYGDSVSAGAVVEAVQNTASNDPEGHEGVYDNSWYAFPMITARNLGARINNIAQGGIAIFDKTGYYHAPDHIGMETVYNKMCYFPEAEGGYTDWDFSKYTPHVVLFAVGQNDPHNEGGEDFDITDPVYREKWKSRYKAIINDLRSKYPRAVFILVLTVLMHDPAWDKAVDEIAREFGDPRVMHFVFKRTGAATPGHPRITEQYEMAEELTAFISGMGDDIWRD